MTPMNPAMLELHRTLVALVVTLSKQLSKTTDPARAAAISREMTELNHRQNLAAGLLFAEQSRSIESRMVGMRRANRRLEKAIASIKTLNKFLEECSAFLGLVDDLIDWLKGPG